MNQRQTKELRLDPRTQIILLILINISIFADQSVLVGDIWSGAIAVLLWSCGCRKITMKFSVIYVCLISLQYYIFPIAPKIIVMIFSIFINYTHRMLPCLMIGALLIKTTTMRSFILALRKLHVSQRLLIPLSVTLRYFPAIFEEVRHIRDGIKLRKISVSKKIECIIVSLMISATNVAEELSAAAVTRGIENPTEKTSVIQLCFGITDIACILGGIIFVCCTSLIL